MSISAEFQKPDPTPVVHRWMLYENGETVGITRSATVVRAVRCHDEVVAALEVTASMLSYEAKCHEESGDEKRRSYVASIRGQVKAARAALASARGEVAS